MSNGKPNRSFQSAARWQLLFLNSAAYFAPMAILIFLTAAPSQAAPMHGTRTVIDTVPDTYTTVSGPLVTEPVSIQNSRFEIEPETLRVRLVVDYTYPDQVYLSKPDGDLGGGPVSTKVQVAGLRYDPRSRAIVYETAGQSTVLASVEECSGRFASRFRIRNTAAWHVTAEKTRHTENDGWASRSFTALDVYFEVQPASDLALLK